MYIQLIIPQVPLEVNHRFVENISLPNPLLASPMAGPAEGNIKELKSPLTLFLQTKER
jgi:hypothetical protein